MLLPKEVISSVVSLRSRFPTRRSAAPVVIDQIEQLAPAPAPIQPRQSCPLHALPAAAVYDALGTRPAGLTADEAQARLRQYGPNLLSETRGKPLIQTLGANFSHLMALLLWIGGLVGFLAGMPELGVAIWMVNLINGLFSFWQEYKADKATAALRRLLPAYARVVRAGSEQRILAEQLVPGDLLLLAEGDRVSADGRLIQESDLRVDQSVLTGESHPAHKTSDALLNSALSQAELPNLVFAGTTIAAGSGLAVVSATGMQTAFGGIARLTQTMGETLSPLQRELSRVTRIVSAMAVGMGLLLFVLATLLAGINLAAGFIFALGMIVAFVPEGLLPTVTLALALGVQRMAHRNALVKRLSSVETLGCTTVICTDKTGTLTQNAMTARTIWLAGRQLSLSGVGFEPVGQLLEQGEPLATPVSGHLRRMLLAAGLCCDARLVPPNDEQPHWTALGDPTEAALLVAAAKGGLDLQAEALALPRLRELPFDSRRKRMTTIHTASGEQTRLAFVKGAPAELLARCTTIQIDDECRPLSDQLRAQVAAANDSYACAGLRVLAVAERRLAPGDADDTPEPVERELTLLGLVAMHDPPRPEVAAAVEQCRRAGIRIIMVTGDYGLTAESIARRIGIVDGPQLRILSGGDLDQLTDAELAEALRGQVLFARVAPEHKLRVVRTLQALGEVVAVTGDGVNDAPALKQADIGVAMGLAGSDVAKEAADMILTDDNFASIVSAVEEGRGVFSNIRKFVSYIFTSNTPEAFPFVFFALSGGRIPLALTVMQVLAIDLGTDMLPALALGAEPPAAGTMDRPPRLRSEHVITGGLLVRAFLWLGMLESLAALGAFYAVYWSQGYWGQLLDLPGSGLLYQAATTATLAAVVLAQVGNLFVHRADERSIFKSLLPAGKGFAVALPGNAEAPHRPDRNSLVWIGITVELALLAAIIYLPWLQGVFGTTPFPMRCWLVLALYAPAIILADELRKVGVILCWRGAHPA